MNQLTKIVIGTLIFIVLFYNQSPGLNISLFTLAILLISYATQSKKSNKTYFYLLASTCIVSCLSFAWYGDAISFFALLISILVSIFYLQFPKLNILLLPLVAFANFFSFPFRIFFFKYWLPAIYGKNYLKNMVATTLIPLIFLILFSIVYATGSDLISNFFSKAFFSSDLAQVILLALLGFFILFNVWVVWVPRLLIEANTKFNYDFRNDNKKSLYLTSNFLNEKQKRSSGEITFTLLNILLLVFILTYNYEQFIMQNGEANLSQEIHQRIVSH